MNNVSGWYIRFGEWALKLFLLNLLWFIFSVLGLLVLGIFPATAALFAVMRKLLMQSEDISIFKLFWNSYKNEFLKSNLLGFVISFIGFLLYIDYRVLQQLSVNILHQSLTITSFILIFLYVLVSIYIFPIFVHFNMSTFGYIKHAFILAIARPLKTLLVIVGLAVILYVLRLVPGLIPVFGVSLFSLLIMKGASYSLPEINNTSQ